MAGRLNSWVCSPWSLFAALPVRGSIPRSWAARHLLGLTESHCCPVVTVHMNRQWVWVESSQGLENRFDPSHPIHKCVSTVQCSMVVKALNLALTTVKTVKRQSLTAWLYTCRWIACFLTLHDSMDRRSQMFTIGWLFVWVTGIIPAVNNSLIGRGFRIFRAIERLCIGHRKYEALAPFPAARKSSRRLNPTWKLLLCKGETVEIRHSQFQFSKLLRKDISSSPSGWWKKTHILAGSPDQRISMTTLLQGFCIWLETMNTYSGNMNHMDTHQILSLPQLLSCGTTGGLEGERSGPNWGQRGFCCAGISR